MTPLLYSFRRCPYAMRARLALSVCGIEVELREVVLRDKPEAFLEVSQSGTVPCLVSGDGPIDESLDIMIWALKKHDPKHWLAMPSDGYAWIERNDGPFKMALDRTKYGPRYPDCDPMQQRDLAMEFLRDLDKQIDGWMFGEATLADFAILPFVRQFAFIDKVWFDAQPLPNVQSWLDRFLCSQAFAAIMQKYPQWQEGDEPLFACGAYAQDKG